MVGLTYNFCHVTDDDISASLYVYYFDEKTF